MQFLIFTGGEKNDLFDLLFTDLRKLPQVTLHPELPRIPDRLGRLWSLHHSPTLNRCRPFPFRGCWSRYCSLYDFRPETGEEYCLVFNNVSIGYYEPSLLNRLKRKFGIKLVLYLLDSYSSYYSKQARIARRQIQFDRVYTFHEPDAQQYQMDFFDTYCSRLPIEEREHSGGAFFWGTDSGRGPVVEQVFELLKSRGIPADFGICYTDPSREKKAGIHYDEPLPYMEMLSRMTAADCIVDIVGEYSKGISLRPYEAVVYGKKLLTNNPLVKTMRFYRPEYMQVFEDPAKIDPEFFTTVEKVDYGYRNEYSPACFVERLQRELEQNIKSRN